MLDRPALSIETLMRLSNGDLERCYQLVMRRIDQHDIAVMKGRVKADPQYRGYLANQSNAILNEIIRRRWLIHN